MATKHAMSARLGAGKLQKLSNGLWSSRAGTPGGAKNSNRNKLAKSVGPATPPVAVVVVVVAKDEGDGTPP
jgi:hypothetical protein